MAKRDTRKARGGSDGAANYGIYGPVNADVLAVGYKPKSTKTVSTSIALPQAQSAIEELRRNVEGLALPQAIRVQINRDLGAMAENVRTEATDQSKLGRILKRVLDGLKTAGVVASDVAEIVEPVRKIAEALAIPLKVLGL
ncbi:MAG TPA: hypothetical protein VMH36_24470 [Alphaproteobacteria bacterium]|nr:hypothetical protein [Alphaproteobacteria bacterium]